jgi:hypothetical protein
LEAHPEASIREAASWLTGAGSTRVDSAQRAIIPGESSPDATPIARGSAGNPGGPQR